MEPAGLRVQSGVVRVEPHRVKDAGGEKREREEQAKKKEEEEEEDGAGMCVA